MKGDKILIVAIQPDPEQGGLLCANPSVGTPIHVGLIAGNLRPDCFIEYWEDGDKFYRVVTKNVEPPKPKCEP